MDIVKFKLQSKTLEAVIRSIRITNGMYLLLVIVLRCKNGAVVLKSSVRVYALFKLFPENYKFSKIIIIYYKCYKVYTTIYPKYYKLLERLDKVQCIYSKSMCPVDALNALIGCRKLSLQHLKWQKTSLVSLLHVIIITGEQPKETLWKD